MKFVKNKKICSFLEESKTRRWHFEMKKIEIFEHYFKN
jgi:hypothetical protein